MERNCITGIHRFYFLFLVIQSNDDFLKKMINHIIYNINFNIMLYINTENKNDPLMYS